MEQRDLNMINQPATSLYVETNENYDTTVVLSTLLKKFVGLLKLFEADNQVMTNYLNEHLAFKDEMVCVHDDNENCDYICKLVGIDENGFLILQDGEDLCQPIRNGTLTKYTK